MPGPPPRQHKHERQYTPSTRSVIPTRRIWNDDDGQMIFGDLGGLKFPDIYLTGEEKPRKTSLRKLVPTGDRSWVRCVTSAHATTCSTAVDLLQYLFIKIMNQKILLLNHIQNFINNRYKFQSPTINTSRGKNALHKHYFNIGEIRSFYILLTLLFRHVEITANLKQKRKNLKGHYHATNRVHKKTLI